MDEPNFREPADSIQASYTHDPIDDLEGPECKEPPSKLAVRLASELSGVTDEKERIRIIHAATRTLRPIDAYASALRGLLSRIISSNDPLLETKAVAIAAGIPIIDEANLVHVGTNHGVGRAAVSKRVRTVQEDFGLKGSHFCKSASSREEYRKRNVRRRAKANGKKPNPNHLTKN